MGDLHVDDLNAAAKPLAQAAGEVGDIPEPQAPDAGASNGPIAELLAALAASAATVASSAANAADQVQAADVLYTGTEQANSQRMTSLDVADGAGR